MVAKTEFATVWPFTCHAKVNASLSASLPVAVKVIDDGIATTAPVAAGDCVAQTGGVFLFTVQVRVAVLVPLLRVAMSVFAPALNCDERILTKADVADKATPFTCQETAQPESLGTTAKEFDVLEAAAIRVVDVDGVEDVKLQSFCTFNDHEQVVLS